MNLLSLESGNANENDKNKTQIMFAYTFPYQYSCFLNKFSIYKYSRAKIFPPSSSQSSYHIQYEPSRDDSFRNILVRVIYI